MSQDKRKEGGGQRLTCNTVLLLLGVITTMLDPASKSLKVLSYFLFSFKI
jgi:hypothetical protein